jgi:hypothetical protein
MRRAAKRECEKDRFVLRPLPQARDVDDDGSMDVGSLEDLEEEMRRVATAPAAVPQRRAEGGPWRTTRRSRRTREDGEESYLLLVLWEVDGVPMALFAEVGESFLGYALEYFLGYYLGLYFLGYFYRYTLYFLGDFSERTLGYFPKYILELYFPSTSSSCTSSSTSSRSSSLNIPGILPELLYSVASAGKGAATCRQLRARVLLNNND